MVLYVFVRGIHGASKKKEGKLGKEGEGVRTTVSIGAHHGYV